MLERGAPARGVEAGVLPPPGMVPCLAASAGAPVGSGDAALAAPVATAEASPRRGSQGWRSSFDDVDCYHACASSTQRVATPWISSSSAPPSPPVSRTPTTPPVSLPPGILAPPASDIGGTLTGFRAIALCGCAWTTPSRAFARTTKVGLTAGVLSCLDRLADRQPWVPTGTPPASHIQRNRRSRFVAPMRKLLTRTNTAGVRLTSSRPSSWNPGPPRGSDQRAFSRPPYRTLAHIICFKEGRGFVTCSSLDDVNRTPSHVTFSRVCPHSS